MSGPPRKRILVLLRKAPHGSIFGQEGLDAALVAGAFEQHVTVLLMGDAVFHLLSDQQPRVLEHPDVVATFRSLADYDIEQIVVQQSALIRRGVVSSDLAMEVTAMDDQAVRELIDIHDVIVSF